MGRSVLVLLLAFGCGARAEGGLGARLRRRSLGLRSSVRSLRSVLVRLVPTKATALAISLAEGGTNDEETGLIIGAAVEAEGTEVVDGGAVTEGTSDHRRGSAAFAFRLLRWDEEGTRLTPVSGLEPRVGIEAV